MPYTYGHNNEIMK